MKLTSPSAETRLWVSIRTYAQQHETSRKTVYKWMEAGLVDIFRVGRFIRVKNQPPADRRSSARQPLA